VWLRIKYWRYESHITPTKDYRPKHQYFILNHTVYQFISIFTTVSLETPTQPILVFTSLPFIYYEMIVGIVQRILTKFYQIKWPVKMPFQNLIWPVMYQIWKDIVLWLALISRPATYVICKHRQKSQICFVLFSLVRSCWSASI